MERPKHLDPVQSYSENEYLLIANIYTPPLQYHYLKRPYELIPFAAQEIPHPAYFDKNDRPLPENADSKSIAYSVYEIHIKPGFKYQPHPAFAIDADGRPVYLGLDAADLAHVYELQRFQANRHAGADRRRLRVRDQSAWRIRACTRPSSG